MLRDIDVPKVTDVAVAIALEVDELGAENYYAYLINLKNETLENVLIRSNGYGVLEDNRYETTELRRFYDDLEPKSFIKIEPVLADALKLSNQYWVSFYVDKVLYDRKYVFVPGSVDPANFIKLPLVEEQGVMIK
jgi:hypothetical protein